MDDLVRVERLLKGVSSRVKAVEFCVRLLLAACILTGILFLGVILDQRSPLPVETRQFFSMLLRITLLGLGFYLAFYLAFRRVSPLFAAKLLEEHFPEFRHSLMAAAMAKEERQRRLLYLQAARMTGVAENARVVPNTRLYVLIYFLASLCLAFFTYAAFSERSTFDSLKRLLRPGEDIVPPTVTRIESVIPGSVEIVEGKTLTISVKTGGMPPEEVLVLCKTKSGRTEKVALASEGYHIWRGSIQDVSESFQYTMHAGDARAGPFEVSVVPVPVVSVLDVRLDYPSYTGLEPKVIKGPDIEALVGTRATVRFRSSNPLREAHLVVYGVEKAASLRDDGIAEGTFTIERSGNYQVLVRDEMAGTNRPANYEIIALADRPPVVRIEKPSREIVLPTPGTLEVIADATDDFGLDALSLYLRRGGEEFRPGGTLRCSGALFKSARFSLDLSKLSLKEGDELVYYVAASDLKEPDANISKTPEYRIRIGKAAEPKSSTTSAGLKAKKPGGGAAEEKRGKGSAESAAAAKESSPGEKASASRKEEAGSAGEQALEEEISKSIEKDWSLIEKLAEELARAEGAGEPSPAEEGAEPGGEKGKPSVPQTAKSEAQAEALSQAGKASSTERGKEGREAREGQVGSPAAAKPSQVAAAKTKMKESSRGAPKAPESAARSSEGARAGRPSTSKGARAAKAGAPSKSRGAGGKGQGFSPTPGKSRGMAGKTSVPGGGSAKGGLPSAGALQAKKPGPAGTGARTGGGGRGSATSVKRLLEEIGKEIEAEESVGKARLYEEKKWDLTGRVVEEVMRRNPNLFNEEFLKSAGVTGEELISFAVRYRQLFRELQARRSEWSLRGSEPYNGERVLGRGVEPGLAIPEIEVSRGAEKEKPGELRRELEEISPEYRELAEEYFKVLSRSR